MLVSLHDNIDLVIHRSIVAETHATISVVAFELSGDVVELRPAGSQQAGGPPERSLKSPALA